MRLRIKKQEPGLMDIDDLAARLEDVEKKKEFLHLSIRALFQFIKDFALDIKEINSDGFKYDISKLSEKFIELKRLKKIQFRFERDKEYIADFIDLQKKYLGDRENELKDIIEILTNAMVTLDSENQQYNEKILQQSEKIEQITFLDDIKKIKQALIAEIEQMRETVKEKQSRDSVKLDSLARQVNTLNTQLEKARKESATDGLTGIYNRKAFDKRLGELVGENTMSRASFSLLMLDIDDFKKINDTYGHQTGDRVILAVINKCRQSIRGEDFLARYGGEEFAIILPGASLKNAVKKANHICQSIATTRYCLDDIPESPTLSVTVSIGVSSLQKSDTFDGITQRADKALYAAKRAGKNRVLSEKEVAL
jgi:diguanylate cyclase